MRILKLCTDNRLHMVQKHEQLSDRLKPLLPSSDVDATSRSINPIAKPVLILHLDAPMTRLQHRGRALSSLIAGGQDDDMALRQPACVMELPGRLASLVTPAGRQ
jgi:hypothetical protein